MIEIPYIYKYTDLDDGKVKYVGIIHSDKNFPKRFLQHRGDRWFLRGLWKIEYAYYRTRSDVEALESHLIEEYKTYNWYNKEKIHYGLCCFCPKGSDIPWIEYKDNYAMPIPIERLVTDYENDLDSLLSQLEGFKEELSYFKSELNNHIKLSLFTWYCERIMDFNDPTDDKYGFYLKERNNELSIQDIYDDYEKWANEKVSEREEWMSSHMFSQKKYEKCPVLNAHIFDDVEEFENELKHRKYAIGKIANGFVYGWIFRTPENEKRYPTRSTGEYFEFNVREQIKG